MADIRQNTKVRDDFNRANENPVQAPWAQANSGVWGPMSIAGNRLIGTQTPPTASGAYWSTEAWTGDKAEVWATAAGAVGNNEDWRLGLMRNDGVGVRDGYTFHYGQSAGNNFWQIRRYDDGSLTSIAFDNTPTEVLSEGHMALVRRNGNDIEGWHSTDSGANWTLILAATDTAYTTDLYAMLGAGGNVMGWDDFGGGPLTFIPQIYRRPNE